MTDFPENNAKHARDQVGSTVRPLILFWRFGRRSDEDDSGCVGLHLCVICFLCFFVYLCLQLPGLASQNSVYAVTALSLGDDGGHF
jgi:hypothetical protein